jgi:hypothetical protein
VLKKGLDVVVVPVLGRWCKMGELFCKDILPFRGAHNHFLVASQDRCTGEVHRVDGIKEPGKTILRRIREVIVECHEKDGLEGQ